MWATDVMKLLVQLNQQDGITIVMVTHEPDMASFCRRQVRVVDGRLATPLRGSHPHVA